MNQNAVAVRLDEDRLPPESPASKGTTPSAAVSAATDFGAWERLLLNEEWLADAPPIPLEAMRRESLYGDHY